MPKLDLPGMREVENTPSMLTRAAALAIDLLILNMIILGPLQMILNTLIPNASYTALQSAPAEFVQALSSIVFFASVIAFLYFVLLEYMIGQTPGKMIFKIEVGTISFWQAVVRSLFIFPFFPFMLLWIVDPLYIAFRKDSKRFLEVISKTQTKQKVLI